MIKYLRKNIGEITKKLINMSKGEYLIEVDKNDKVIGKLTKYEAHTADIINQDRLHRAFSLFVFDENKRLLLQKRSNHKVTFPSLWTNTVCSHPLYNDLELEEKDDLGLRRAARRRLMIEMNMEH